MLITPIVDHPALRLSDGESILCAGDLHIGIENEMRSKGVHVPSQTSRMQTELLQIAEGTDRLVLLGDVKHQVPGTSIQEYSELPRFFQALRRGYKIIDVVRGNHDVGLEEIDLEGVHIHPASGFVFEDVGFAHGHTWPSQAVMASRTLVMAHNHPAVMFRDGLGHTMTERCWLRAPVKQGSSSKYMELPEEVILVPSLNRTLQGSPINLADGKLLGPLFTQEIVDLPNAKVYLIDGIYLGMVKDLLVERPQRYSIDRMESRRPRRENGKMGKREGV
jgi:putative SbcD/Mre11-related phosphoesterase